MAMRIHGSAELLALFFCAHVVAAPLKDVPVDSGQDLPPLFASGDEFSHRVHDAAGFTVVRDPVSMLLVYADLKGGKLVPTGLVFGASDPRDQGIAPGLAEPPKAPLLGAYARRPQRLRGAPKVGLLNNLVVFIRFSDDPPFDHPVSDYQTLFNDLSGPSLYGYFREDSYGRLIVRSTFYPRPDGDTVVSYVADKPRAYYQPFHPVANKDGYQDLLDAIAREHELIEAALVAIAEEVPPDLDVDGDDDGMVDNIVLVVRGEPDGWSDLLWPHQSILTRMVVIGGAVALQYNFQLDSLLHTNKHLGVLAHELSHTLGAPDLYHYSYDGLSPVGPWDLMEQDQLIPQHHCAYMKWRYFKWIDNIPEVRASGRYTLGPLSRAPQALRFPILGSKEYFVVEYRQASGTYDASLPGSGLLVYRVNPAKDLQGNADGPPDEIQVFRPGGSAISNGKVEEAFMSLESGRTRLAEDSDPYPFLSGGTPALFRIYDVSDAGPTISFSVCLRVPSCAGQECGDDSCGGVCGECSSPQVCEDGLCGGAKTCAEYLACHDTCPKCNCEEGLSGRARRAKEALAACMENRCAGVKDLALCRLTMCGGPWADCVAGGDPAARQALLRTAHKAACEVRLCPVCLRARDSACEACLSSMGQCPDLPTCGGRVAEASCAPLACGEALCVPLPPSCAPPWSPNPPGCPHCPCEACTCAADPYCCEVAWDAACSKVCAEQCGGPKCDGLCIPSCKACGDDGCGGICPPCPPSPNQCEVTFCASGRCAVWPARDGWPCEDGSKCSVGDRCIAGVCTPREWVQCKAPDPCHEPGTCDPATGRCSAPSPIPDASCPEPEVWASDAPSEAAGEGVGVALADEGSSEADIAGPEATPAADAHAPPGHAHGCTPSPAPSLAVVWLICLVCLAVRPRRRR